MPDLGSFDEVDAFALIRHLNDSDEHTRCEAKSSTQFGRPLMETICAFANEPGLGGGFILAGAARQEMLLWPTYDFVNIDSIDKLQAEIATSCRTEFNRPIRPQMRVEEVNGKCVVVIFVSESGNAEKPIHFIKDGLPRGAFRRIGSSNQRCSEDDLIVFYGNQHRETLDRQVISDGTPDDIDPQAIAIYRTMRRNIKPNAEELAWSDEELLLAISCVKASDNGLRPTIAGIILFGTQKALRRCFPMMRVDYVRVPGLRWVEDPDQRFDTIEIREPLVRAIQRTHRIILDDVPKAFSLPEGQVQRGDIPSLPDGVIREVVVNALMHRCYRTHSAVQIIKYSNRIEIRNPGHSLVSEDRLGQPGSETRNPVIASVLYDLGLAETKGSGIRAMRTLMERANLSPPVLESDREGNRFVAYLLLHHLLAPEDIDWLAGFAELDLSDDEKRALIVARELDAIDNATYRSVNGCDTLTASQHLRKLRNYDLLEMKGKGAKTYYKPTAYMLNPKIAAPSVPVAADPKIALSGERRPLSGELSAQSGGLDPGDSDEIPEEVASRLPTLARRMTREMMRKAILELCAWKPLMPSELAHFLNRKSTKRLVEDYVSPMTIEGVLERTIPDKPVHPAQKYKTTDAGARILFVSGP